MNYLYIKSAIIIKNRLFLRSFGVRFILKDENSSYDSIIKKLRFTEYIHFLTEKLINKELKLTIGLMMLLFLGNTSSA